MSPGRTRRACSAVSSFQLTHWPFWTCVQPSLLGSDFAAAGTAIKAAEAAARKRTGFTRPLLRPPKKRQAEGGVLRSAPRKTRTIAGLVRLRDRALLSPGKLLVHVAGLEGRGTIADRPVGMERFELR